jgi:uncharacterized protein YjbJ (UPF0337 family)
MGKLKDKVAGKAKQAVAEVTGDGRLVEEGTQQSKKSEPVVKPLGNLDKLV